MLFVPLSITVSFPPKELTVRLSAFRQMTSPLLVPSTVMFDSVTVMVQAGVAEAGI